MGTKTYFIQAEHGGPVKIGVAIRPESRLKGVQTGNPYRLVIRGVVEEDIESKLHCRYSRWRLSGEWFAVDSTLADMVLVDHGIELVVDEDTAIKDALRQVSSWERVTYKEMLEALSSDEGLAAAIRHNINKQRFEQSEEQRLAKEKSEQDFLDSAKFRLRRFPRRDIDWRSPVESSQWVFEEAAKLLRWWRTMEPGLRKRLHDEIGAGAIREARQILRERLIHSVPSILTDQSPEEFLYLLRRSLRVNSDIYWAEVDSMKDYKFSYLKVFEPGIYARACARSRFARSKFTAKWNREVNAA